MALFAAVEIAVVSRVPGRWLESPVISRAPLAFRPCSCIPQEWRWRSAFEPQQPVASSSEHIRTASRQRQCLRSALGAGGHCARPKRLGLVHRRRRPRPNKWRMYMTRPLRKLCVVAIENNCPVSVIVFSTLNYINQWINLM